MQQKSGAGDKQAGRWTKEQHQRFMYAIMQYGKDWKKVQQYVRTRSGSQVRSHAQKFFNKLQKTDPTQESQQKFQKDNSESEFDVERQINNEMTPSTPHELVSLIKRQSKEDGGKVDIRVFQKTLEQQSLEGEHKGNLPESLRSSSYKSMSNLLSVYEEVNQDKEEKSKEDESFLILLTKKYKKYFGKSYDFNQLIDVHAPITQSNPPRKRSFTLPQGNSLSEDQLDEKIEEIKKKIKTDPNNEKSKSEKIQLPEEGILHLARLQTIQQHPREDEDLGSFRALPSLDDPQEATQSKLN